MQICNPKKQEQRHCELYIHFVFLGRAFRILWTVAADMEQGGGDESGSHCTEKGASEGLNYLSS